jgi:hypothetical protein
MKKRILIGVAGLALVAAAAITTISTINGNTPESDLLSKNLEALTQGEEGSEPGVKYVDQGSRFVYDDQGNYVYKAWCYCFDEGTAVCPC